MQSNETWKELVQQVKEGARPEDALGLREQQENLSTLGIIVPNSGRYTFFMYRYRRILAATGCKWSGGHAPVLSAP